MAADPTGVLGFVGFGVLLGGLLGYALAMAHNRMDARRRDGGYQPTRPTLDRSNPPPGKGNPDRPPAKPIGGDR